MAILVVEDDRSMQRSLQQGLEELEYEVCTADTVKKAEEQLRNKRFDLVILDLGLPDGEGLDVVEKMRARNEQTPVIILTAKDQVEDKVTALEHGADDYLVKPFDFSELVARVNVQLRRHQQSTENVLVAGDIMIDLIRRTVKRGSDMIELAPREFDLLAFLAQSPGKAVSREQLARNVWNIRSRMTSMDNVLDVNISRLRDKVDKGFDVKRIRTVRGIGFMLWNEE